MSETETIRFDSLDISSEVLRAVARMGFTEATPVQAQTIPVMMAGHDVIAIAPTGTGKTCAFGIPMLEYLQLKDDGIQELVLAPTRELALQIAEELTALARFIPGARIATLYGGQPIKKQLAALKRKPQILVATPGRMLDMMERKQARLDGGQGCDDDHRGNTFGPAACHVLGNDKPGRDDHQLEIPVPACGDHDRGRG